MAGNLLKESCARGESTSSAGTPDWIGMDSCRARSIRLIEGACHGCGRTAVTKLLPCSHAFCEHCSQSDMDAPCPLCFIEKSLDSPAHTKRTACSMDASAEVFLSKDDSGYNGGKESEALVDQEISANLCDILELTPPPDMVSCRIHPNQELNVFCQTCARMTCQTCQLMEHTGHTVLLADNVAVQKSILSGIVDGLSGKMEALRGMHQYASQKMQWIEEAKLIAQQSLDRWKRALLKRLDDLSAESNQRFESEQNMCATIVKTTSEMRQHSAEVQRLAIQACKEDQKDTDGRPLLPLLECSWTQIATVNTSMGVCHAALRQPIPRLALIPEQQLADMGGFVDAADGARRRSTPIAAAHSRLVGPSSAFPFVTRPAYRFTMEQQPTNVITRMLNPFTSQNQQVSGLPACSFQRQWSPSVTALNLSTYRSPSARSHSAASSESRQHHRALVFPNSGTAPTPPAHLSQASSPPVDRNLPSVQFAEFTSSPVNSGIRIVTRKRGRRQALPYGRRGRVTKRKLSTTGDTNTRKSVQLVVEEVAKKRNNSEFENGMASYSTPLPQHDRSNRMTAHASEFEESRTTRVDSTDALDSLTETRLVIDESDSGVELAITVEETIIPESLSNSVEEIDKLDESLDVSIFESIHDEGPLEIDSETHLTQAGDGLQLIGLGCDELCSVCNTDDGRPVKRCCGETCGRVYHGNHHVPEFQVEENTNEREDNEKWYCTLCVSEMEAVKGTRFSILDYPAVGLNQYEQKACERILLYLYIHPDSIMFHEPVDQSLNEYYKVISCPIDFSIVRHRLATGKYKKVNDFVIDLNRVFENCFVYNKDRDPENWALGSSVAECYRQLASLHFPALAHLLKSPGIGD